MVFSTEGRAFELGPRTSLPDPRGVPDIHFAADPGDDLRFVLDRGGLSWPTPFEMNFMTGYAPSWRRNVYYRLVWKKASGATPRMVWGHEQPLHRNEGGFGHGYSVS